MAKKWKDKNIARREFEADKQSRCSRWDNLKFEKKAWTKQNSEKHSFTRLRAKIGKTEALTTLYFSDLSVWKSLHE